MFFHVVALCLSYSRSTFFVTNVRFALALLLVPFVFLYVFFVLFLFGRQGWGWVTDFLTLLTSVVLHH